MDRKEDPPYDEKRKERPPTRERDKVKEAEREGSSVVVKMKPEKCKDSSSCCAWKGSKLLNVETAASLEKMDRMADEMRGRPRGEGCVAGMRRNEGTLEIMCGITVRATKQPNQFTLEFRRADDAEKAREEMLQHMEVGG